LRKTYARLGNVGDFVAEAFTRKAWSSEFGFYKMLGSRQSVMERVNTALYGISDGENHPYLIYRDSDFQTALNGFQETLGHDNSNYNISGVAYPLANYVITRTSWHNGPFLGRPYEWGNPTDGSPAYFKENLKTSNIGWGSTNVLYTSGNWGEENQDLTSGTITPIFFVLTQGQQQTGSVKNIV
jgi:hypothetical protein